MTKIGASDVLSVGDGVGLGLESMIEEVVLEVGEVLTVVSKTEAMVATLEVRDVLEVSPRLRL